jgi:hypothetical protein
MSKGILSLLIRPPISRPRPPVRLSALRVTREVSVCPAFWLLPGQIEQPSARQDEMQLPAVKMHGQSLRTPGGMHSPGLASDASESAGLRGAQTAALTLGGALATGLFEWMP